MMNDPAAFAAATVARVAANVRAALGWRGLKDHQLTAPLALSTAAVSRRLTGAVAFDIGELSVVSGIVGVSVGDLVDRDPWSPPAETTRKEEILPGWPDPDARPTY